MIEVLAWDTAFFGRRIGILAGGPVSVDALRADLASAAVAGYHYVVARPPIADATGVRALEEAGFYLTDIGAVWRSPVSRYLETASAPSPDVRPATEADVPQLADEAVRLFRQSRFYHDPFFTDAEADRLHAEWLANSVAGRAADAVWISPEAGFVTCKLAKDGEGEVVLIGVWEGSRGRGAGRGLMTAAMVWFRSQGVPAVRVKTQLKNTQAMNFYHRLGFDMHAAELTMGCVLQPRTPGAYTGGDRD